MSRTKSLLAAGTFIGLVLITIMALGLGTLKAQPAGDANAAPESNAQPTASNDLTDEETIQAWKDYSTQLEQAVRALQERERIYQERLNTSNQTIVQLQDQINTNPAPPFFRNSDEHERQEHEGLEFGEFDD
ncbi:MAG: hypothetical protein ACK2T3_16905 [Candidatus Promineifilaceae bacterium]|jgi:hypothetical protein